MKWRSFINYLFIFDSFIAQVHRHLMEIILIHRHRLLDLDHLQMLPMVKIKINSINKVQIMHLNKLEDHRINKLHMLKSNIIILNINSRNLINNSNKTHNKVQFKVANYYSS